MGKVIYEKKMDVVNFISAINDIADGYFDSEGIYHPEYGLINAMRIFYNRCVTDGKFEKDFSHDIVDVLEVEKIICDNDFCEAFNEAITVYRYDIDFGNAFRTALDIVENRKSNSGSFLELIKNIIKSLTKDLSGIMTEENLNYISEIGKEILSGKMGTEAIVDLYQKNLEKQSNES